MYDEPGRYDRPGGNGPSGGESPALWLGLSIFSTLCCCLPFGIVGIVFSAMAMSERDREGTDGYEFQRLVGRARTWTITAIVCGVIAGVISLLVRFSGTR